MKLLNDEDNGLYLADRTISLQYRQFRTPRKDLKELILNNHKTHLLSDTEKQKYLKWNSNGNGNGNEDISKIKEKIYVDTEGFSIEIAKKLGNNYLGNNCILVSTKQENCNSIRYNCLGKNKDNIITTNKNAIIRKIYDAHRNTIDQILMGEVLVGTDKQRDLDILIDNPDSLFNIEMKFDTPNNALSKLKNIRKNEKILLENEGKLKDRRFLGKLLSSIEDISTDHGSLDRIPDNEIHIKEKVRFNKLRIDDIDIYCIKHTNDINIFVYFSNDDKEIYMSDGIIILNGKDIESLRVLIELGVVGYNPYIGLERAANMISERAKELLADIELLVKNNRDKDFFVNLGRNKIYMTYPLIQNEILYELLTRMEDDEYKSNYMDTEKFISTVSNMNDEQLREFIEKTLNSLEFVEENNTMANMWLKENKKDICADLGIKFVQN